MFCKNSREEIAALLSIFFHEKFYKLYKILYILINIKSPCSPGAYFIVCNLVGNIISHIWEIFGSDYFIFENFDHYKLPHFPASNG